MELNFENEIVYSSLSELCWANVQSGTSNRDAISRSDYSNTHRCHLNARLSTQQECTRHAATSGQEDHGLTGEEGGAVRQCKLRHVDVVR